MYAKDIASSLFMLAIAIAFWLGASAIPVSPLEGQVGAAGFPKLLALSLGALTVIRIAQVVLTARRAGGKLSPAVEADDTTGWIGAAWREHRRAFGMIAIGAAYVVLLPILGYPLSIALLIAGVAVYSGRRPTIGLAIVTIIGAAVLYGMFVWLLNVHMPVGIWATLGAR